MRILDMLMGCCTYRWRYSKSERYRQCKLCLRTQMFCDTYTDYINMGLMDWDSIKDK